MRLSAAERDALLTGLSGLRTALDQPMSSLERAKSRGAIDWLIALVDGERVIGRTRPEASGVQFTSREHTEGVNG